MVHYGPPTTRRSAAAAHLPEVWQPPHPGRWTVKRRQVDGPPLQCLRRPEHRRRGRLQRRGQRARLLVRRRRSRLSRLSTWRSSAAGPPASPRRSSPAAIDPPSRSSCWKARRSQAPRILVSGGARCNVTNARVAESDFWGGRRAIVRRVLRALPVRPRSTSSRRSACRCTRRQTASSSRTRTARAMCSIGCCAEAAHVGVVLQNDTRVVALERAPEGFKLSTSRGSILARAVVLATGGRSLPKSGSDGQAIELARSDGTHDRSDHAGAGAARPRFFTGAGAGLGALPALPACPACPACPFGPFHRRRADRLDRRNGRGTAARDRCCGPTSASAVRWC